jgi:formate/nitrite transporter FocA (FNT family)
MAVGYIEQVVSFQDVFNNLVISGIGNVLGCLLTVLMNSWGET